MLKALAVCDDQRDHPSAKRYMPTRLIDLGATISTGDQSGLRLVLTKRIPIAEFESIRYAALSYCWGDARLQSKTTSANLQEHLDGLTLSNTSPVIRDAIEVRADETCETQWRSF